MEAANKEANANSTSMTKEEMATTKDTGNGSLWPCSAQAWSLVLSPKRMDEPMHPIVGFPTSHGRDGTSVQATPAPESSDVKKGEPLND